MARIHDDADGDIDDRNGVIEILDVPAGDYMVTETTVPDGYVGGADVPMTIVPGERAEVTVMNEFATGSISIAKIDEEGTPIGGACFVVGEQEVCDNAEADASVEPGIIQVDGLRTGAVTIAESVAPEGFNLDPNPQTVDVLGEVTSVSFVNTVITGSLIINKTDENGAFLEGSCFIVNDVEFCDNGDGDENPETGSIQISGLPPGDVTITGNSRSGRICHR
ncbi:MAG: SpaA isopeptide-forming pilin-related protein [Thermomicrobiales bacterium]